jgi:hypothetical protein
MEITQIEKTNRVESRSYSSPLINIFYKKMLWPALLMGVLMGGYTVMVQYNTDTSTASFLKPVKYLIMLGGLYLLLNRYKRETNNEFIFFKGALLGVYTSIAIAISLVVTLDLSQWAFQSLEISKYNRVIDSFSEVITYNWILLAETFVFGIISTFVVLQGLKRGKVPRI